MNAHGLQGPTQPPKGIFVATTVVIFFLSLSAADSAGFVPCYVDGTECTSQQIALSNLPELGTETAAVSVAEEAQKTPASPAVFPERIVISAIDLDLPVQNPTTHNIATLDEYLKDGPVRYTDSAKLGEKGNVLIFAHTSHLPVVKNQMYKAFNRIPELTPGETITVQGGGRSFVYNVTSVRRADATEAMIDLSPILGKKLTLVTCDTLTGKSARYIVEADFAAVL